MLYCHVELMKVREQQRGMAEASSQQGPDHRRRAGRLHRGDLCRARQSAADAGHRAAARRPADDHDRCRELSRLRRHHPGPLADGADAETGRACRHPDHPRPWSTRSICRAGRLSRPAIRATVYVGETVIIATGAQARWLGLPERGRRFAGSASRPARPATGSSSATRKWSSSAAATPRSRRRSI